MQEATAETGAAVELSGLPPDVSDELLTLYFENRRRSSGGPVQSWQRLGRGGVLTFLEPADAANVLAQEHRLHGALLSLRPAPPRAPARLLLLDLPPGTAPLSLERHVQLLLRAVGLPELPCCALDSPRPDRALVQLHQPISEAEACALKEQAAFLGLNDGQGVPVSLAQVPQARAVRVLGGSDSLDPLLLELYLENERRSGGGALEGWRNLPGQMGTVVTFRQWQVAERVLQREHCLQGVELCLVPHYDVLEPEGLTEATSGEGDLAVPGSDFTDLIPPKTPAADSGMEPETGACSESVGQWEGPAQSPGQAETGQIPEQARTLSPASKGALGTVSQVEEAGTRSLQQEDLVERVLCMEPGAMRFMQLFQGDLLASLGDVAIFPIGGPETTGFRLCGAPTLCQAAEEFLQSLLGSISCHVLRLQHPGSARFLLGPDGQLLLRELESQFRCVFGTERLSGLVLDTEAAEVDPMEVLQAPPWPPIGTDRKQQAVNMEEVQELLASIEGLEQKDWQPLEPREEEPEGQPEEEDSAGTSEDYGVSGQLEEEAALQLALHRSLEPPVWTAEQKEAAALQQALARSLLESSLMEVDQELLTAEGVAAAEAQLLVHVAFEQDVEELGRALNAALGKHLQEEVVELGGCPPASELCARLKQCHSVSLTLRGDTAVIRGFGVQPARAARHLATLLAAPQDQNWASFLDPGPTADGEGPQGHAEPVQSLKGPSGQLEPLAENSAEFQEVVRAFYNTLDAAYNKIRVLKVERVSHPLLRHQYQLHREQLEQRCERRPVERVLYHGTAGPAVREICAQGFNRSFCGRNGTLYGQGVYFALRASLSVQDRYSPPDARGRKAVFVARVLTGDYAQGHRQLRAPPVRAGGDSPLRYDSAVDCLREPSIFIIFHDTQALPTHLITCERLATRDASRRPGPAPET